MSGRFSLWLAAAVALLSVHVTSVVAQDAAWTVSKSSGEAWVGSASQQASLSQQTQLRPGDSVRTGRNGRVLLVRGQETILVSPNSAISLPEEGRSGLSTVIQQAGSIMLDVEKRNVQHFEVETPYLAAVVKGTRFQVTIVGGQTKVDVVRGQVQVTDFRSGDHALVNPQQFARSSAGASSGLRLGGSGQLDSVLRGTPQNPRVQPLRVPAGGLRPDSNSVPLRSAPSTTSASASGSGQPVIERSSNGGARIVAPIGELRLDIRQVTNGMARSDSGSNGNPKDWAGRLQPSNGGNTAKSENSGASSSIGAASGSAAGAGTTGTSAPSPATGVIILSNAAVNAVGPMGGSGNAVGPGGNPAGPSSNGPAAPGRSPAAGPGAAGPAAGPGAAAGAGRGPGTGNGLLGVIAQFADDLGLGGLVDNRGRGNAYGLNGGNGVGKALGLGKKH